MPLKTQQTKLLREQLHLMQHKFLLNILRLGFVQLAKYLEGNTSAATGFPVTAQNTPEKRGKKIK